MAEINQEGSIKEWLWGIIKRPLVIVLLLLFSITRYVLGDFQFVGLIISSMGILCMIIYGAGIACIIGCLLFAFISTICAKHLWGLICVISAIALISMLAIYNSQHIPTYSTEKQRTGAIAMDGWKSDATGSGATSHHGGVREWLYTEIYMPLPSNEILWWKIDNIWIPVCLSAFFAFSLSIGLYERFATGRGLSTVPQLPDTRKSNFQLATFFVPIGGGLAVATIMVLTSKAPTAIPNQSTSPSSLSQYASTPATETTQSTPRSTVMLGRGDTPLDQLWNRAQAEDEAHKTLSAQLLQSGLNKLNNGNYNGAIEDFTFVIGYDSKNINAYYNRGRAKGLKGDYDGAIEDCNETIKLNPKLANSYNIRGASEFCKGNYDAAIADYTEAIALNPTYALAYKNRAGAEKIKGDLKGSAADNARAKELDPQIIP